MDKGIEALIAKVKRQTESFDTVVLKEDEAKALIAALERAQRQNGQLKAERDALRETGLNGQADTRAAADIYFQLIEECDIPPGGSLVQHVDWMRDRIAELESSPHHNGMMQLSNELAEMRRKCVELENQKFDTAKLINKFYTRCPLESFKSDPERAETLGYYMAGAEVQHFGDFVVYEMPEDDEGSE